MAAAVSLAAGAGTDLERAKINYDYRSDPRGRVAALAGLDFDAGPGKVLQQADPNDASAQAVVSAAVIREQRDAFIAARVEAVGYVEALQQWTKAQQDAAKSSRSAASRAEREAQRDYNRDLREAGSIYEQTRTAAETYADELARLNELRATPLQGGRPGDMLIDQQTYDRAVQQMNERLTQAGLFTGSVTDTLRDGFSSLFSSVIEGGQEAGDVIEGLGKRLAAMALQESVFRMLAMMAPGVFGGGGFVPLVRAATGGYVSGPGTSTSDSIPAALSDGEFVINARATRQHRALLEAINGGGIRLAAGGMVSRAMTAAAPAVRSGGIQIVNQTSGRIDEVEEQQVAGPGGAGMTRIVMREVNNGFSRGMADKAMGRFGARPTPVKR